MLGQLKAAAENTLSNMAAAPLGPNGGSSTNLSRVERVRASGNVQDENSVPSNAVNALAAEMVKEPQPPQEQKKTYPDVTASGEQEAPENIPLLDEDVTNETKDSIDKISEHEVNTTASDEDSVEEQSDNNEQINEAVDDYEHGVCVNSDVGDEEAVDEEEYNVEGETEEEDSPAETATQEGPIDAEKLPNEAEEDGPDESDYDSDSQDDGIDFLSACLLSRRAASEAITYEDHEAAMIELNAMWEEALCATMQQSEELIQEQAKLIEEERKIQEVRMKEEIGQAFEVAVLNEEKMAEMEKHHKKQVEELSGQIEQVKHEALMQSRKIIEEMRIEAVEAAMRDAREEFANEKEQALSSLRQQYEDKELNVLVQKYENEMKEKDDIIARLRAQLRENGTRSEEAAAVVKEGNEQDLHATIHKSVAEAKESCERDHKKALDELKSQMEARLNNAREAHKNEMELLTEKHELELSTIRQQIEKEFALNVKEEIEACRMKLEAEKQAAVEAALYAQRREHQAAIEELKKENSHAMASVNEEKEREVEAVMIALSEELAKEQHHGLDQLLTEMQDKLSISQEEHDDKIKELMKKHELELQSVRQQMYEQHQIEVRSTRQKIEEEQATFLEGKMAACRAEVEEEKEKEKEVALSMLRDELIKTHEAEFRRIREQSSRILAEATERLEGQIRQLQSDYEAQIQHVNDCAALEREEALSRHRDAVKKIKDERDQAIADAVNRVEMMTQENGKKMESRESVLEDAMRIAAKENDNAVTEAVAKAVSKVREDLEKKHRENVAKAISEKEKELKLSFEWSTRLQVEEALKIAEEEHTKRQADAVREATEKLQEFHEVTLKKQLADVRDAVEEEWSKEQTKLLEKTAKQVEKAKVERDELVRLAVDEAIKRVRQVHEKNLATQKEQLMKVHALELNDLKLRLSERHGHLTESGVSEQTKKIDIKLASDPSNEEYLRKTSNLNEMRSPTSGVVFSADNAAGIVQSSGEYHSSNRAKEPVSSPRHQADADSAERAAVEISIEIPKSSGKESEVGQQFEPLSPLTMGSPMVSSDFRKPRRTFSDQQRIKKRLIDSHEKSKTTLPHENRQTSRKAPLPDFSSHKKRPLNPAGRKSALKKIDGNSPATRSSESSQQVKIKTPGEGTMGTAANRQTSRTGLGPRSIVSSRRRKSGVVSTYTVGSSSPVKPEDVRIMVANNIPVTEKMKKMIETLGAKLLENIEDAASATHVIAGDTNHPLRRTPKLMICLCITSNILHMDWLRQSFKEKTFVNCNHYLLLNDRIAEQNYSFFMKQTLREGNERRSEGGLLAGWRVLFCRGVAGNKAPKEEELKLIVDAAGGSVLEYSQLPLPDTEDTAHVIVITSDPALPEQVSDERVAHAANDGAGFFSTTWLFSCIIHQKLSGIKRGLGRCRDNPAFPTIAEEIEQEI